MFLSALFTAASRALISSRLVSFPSRYEMLPMWHRALDRWPSENVGVQVLVLAAADGLDEVGEVVGVLAAVELCDLLAVLVEGRAAGVAGQHDVASLPSKITPTPAPFRFSVFRPRTSNTSVLARSRE